MSVKYAFHLTSSALKWLFQREPTMIDRERLSLLMLCYLPIIVIGITLNFLGWTEPHARFFIYTHSALLLLAGVFLGLFLNRRIKVATCLIAFITISQTVVSIEMIYCALHPSPYYSMLILANVVLLAMNAVASMVCYFKYSTPLLSAATVAVYAACAYITGDALLKSFIAVFALTLCFVSVAAALGRIVIHRLEKQNARLRQEDADILLMLNLKKEEVKSYIELASKEQSHDDTAFFLSRLGEKTRRNLISNVANYVTVEQTSLKKVAEAFPEFSPSEVEICQLILQGKKQGEICAALNKSESNINSQRTNMRRKLGLRPSDNLHAALQQRLKHHI